MKSYGAETFDELLKQAAASPRLRANLNIHGSLDDPINRLFIAALPGSPFAIQRHPDRWELVSCLRGRFISRIHDDTGMVVAEYRMGDDCVTVEIPAGTWHSLEVLEPAVFLEVKPGESRPLFSVRDKAEK